MPNSSSDTTTLFNHNSPATCVFSQFKTLESGAGRIISALIFGRLMDQQHYRGVFLGLALVQGVLIFTAFSVKKEIGRASCRERVCT